MDKRLEKIRRFQANVKDFESYINDRIEQTKKENSVNESFAKEPYEEYGLIPTKQFPPECLNHIVTNIENFGRRYDIALDIIGKTGCPLKHADTELFGEIQDATNEWLASIGISECDPEEIENVFA